MVRRSVPFSSRWVAKQWRNECIVTGFVRPEFCQAVWQTACSVRTLRCWSGLELGNNHLMGQIAKRAEDKRLLKLIRAFLNAGVMENGLVSPSVEGTPQGGPLRRCSVTSCSMNSTGSWSAGGTALCAMRMIATSTFAASGRVNG